MTDGKIARVVVSKFDRAFALLKIGDTVICSDLNNAHYRDYFESMAKQINAAVVPLIAKVREDALEEAAQKFMELCENFDDESRVIVAIRALSAPGGDQK